MAQGTFAENCSKKRVLVRLKRRITRKSAMDSVQTAVTRRLQIRRFWRKRLRRHAKIPTPQPMGMPKRGAPKTKHTKN